MGLQSSGGALAVRCAVLALLFMAVGCTSSSGPDIHSSVAPNVDFRGIKTYGFLSDLATDSRDYESIESSFLKVAVAQQAEQRGLRYDPRNPDVVFNFYIHTTDKIRSRSTPTMHGGYYGYRGGYYSGFGYGGTAYETRIEQYTVGTLTIDMVDPQARKVLWEGTASGRVTQKAVENLEAAIDSAVADIFYQFPVLDVQPQQ
jgi:hypothetical protein